MRYSEYELLLMKNKKRESVFTYLEDYFLKNNSSKTAVSLFLREQRGCYQNFTSDWLVCQATPTESAMSYQQTTRTTQRTVFYVYARRTRRMNVQLNALKNAPCGLTFMQTLLPNLPPPPPP